METEELRQQLACLERRFHRLQYGVVVTLVALSAVMLMGQTASNRVVTANEFVLQDSAGRNRAKLEVVDEEAQLTIQDAQGRRRVRLGENRDRLLTGAHPYGARLELSGENHEIDLWTATDSDLVFAAQGHTEVVLSGSRPGTLLEPSLLLSSSNGSDITLDTKFPNIEVTDAEGLQTQIGSVNLVAPRIGTTKTSAASVTLLAKDGKILWSTPQ